MSNIVLSTFALVTSLLVWQVPDCDQVSGATSEIYASYTDGRLDASLTLEALERLNRCEEISREDVDRISQRRFAVLSQAIRTWQIERPVAIQMMTELLDDYEHRYEHTGLPGWYYKDRSFLLQLQGESMLGIAAMRAALARELTVGDRVGVLRRLARELQRSGLSHEALEPAHQAVHFAEQLDSALTLFTTKRIRATTVLVAGVSGFVQDTAAIHAAIEEYLEVERGHLQHEGSLSNPQELLHGISRGFTAYFLAISYQWLGRYEDAIAAAQRAIEAAEATSARSGPGRIVLGSTLRAAGRFAESESVLAGVLHAPDLLRHHRVWSHDQYAQTLTELGRYDEAEHHFREAVRLRQQEVRTLGASDARVEQMAFYGRDHVRFAAFLLHTGRLEEALLELDKLRARTLRQTQDVEVLSEEERAVFDGLRRERIRLRSELATHEQPELIESQLARVEAELARVVSADTLAADLTLADIQRRLAPDGRVLISYFLATPAYAFVVRADTFAVVRLDIDLPELSRRVEDAVGFRYRSAGRLHVDGHALYDIYRLVLAPVIDLIPERAPVTVIPDGVLHEIPFGMLVDAEPSPHQFHEWSYLVRRNPISVDLAAALVGGPRLSTGVGDWSIGAFGVGDFKWADRSTGNQMKALPSVQAELFSIRHHFPRGKYFTDREATRSAFFEAMGRSRILHVASHVIVNVDQPIFSTVMLGGREEEDQAIHLYDIVDRHMVGELVVLSACDSGRGRFRLNDGVLGLQTVFRVAGASASVATMWAVDDAVAADVIERFYFHLRSGEPKDVALQKAQLDYLARHVGIEASPFLWAGFSLSGDPSPLTDPINDRRDLLLVLAGLMLLVGAHVVVRRRAGS